MKITLLILSLVATAALGGLVACQATDPEATPESTPPSPLAEPLPSDPYERALLIDLEETAPLEGVGLHNVFRLGDRIISGSEPQGEAAFDQLAAMGVKTILTVDGKTPDVEAARTRGMRYVHVPIQYAGIPAETISRLAKSFHELEGPFYVHCFHGRHRGPAAAAVGRLALDGVPRELALAEMRQWCGTSKKYGGLYETIAEMEVPTREDSQGLAWDFPERLVMDGFQAVMIESVRARDNMKILAARDWEVDPAHPDIDLLNEAEKLFEAFAASVEMDEVKEEPQDFRDWVDISHRASREVRDTARALREQPGDADLKRQLTESFDLVVGTCTACHRVYRD